MIIGLERLVLARLIDVVPTSGKPFYNGPFCALAGRSLEFISTGSGGELEFDQRVFRRVYSIMSELDIVFSIIEKIAKITEFWYDGFLNALDWKAYIQADIHSLHVELRSLCDSIALLLRLTGGAGQSPDSFTQLRNWCKKEDRARRLLGVPILHQIRGAEWYDILVDTRDRIIHHRVDVSVKYQYGIMFRLFKDVLPTDSEFKYTPFMEGDWVKFGLYAGYLIGSLIAFLNEVAYDTRGYLAPNTNSYGYIPARSGVATHFMEAARDSLMQKLRS